MTTTPRFQLSDPFPKDEYLQRIERFHESLRRRKLDGMLLFAIESHNYLYQYDQVGAWFFQTLIVPTGKPPAALIRHADQWLISQSPFIEDVTTWRDSDDSPVGKLADVVRRLDLVGKRIGYEATTQFMNIRNFEAVRAVLAGLGCELVDASEVVPELRLIKSPAEISNMRQAAKLMDVGFSTIFDSIRPGVRECDVYGDALRAVYRAGASQLAGPMAVASGTNTLTFSHYTPTRKFIERGDAVLLEVGGCFNHYNAVGAHTVAVGTATSRMRELYEQSFQTVAAARPRLGPGVPAADVAAAMADTLDAAAQRDWGIHFGYGTGIGSAMFWFDSLRINRNSRYTLEPGMTFFLFSGRLHAEEYFILVGEPVLITSDGYEALSSLPLEELRIVGS